MGNAALLTSSWPALLVVAVLAAILGFSAHRASICTVRAVAELLHSRRGFMMMSIVKSMLWISAVTVPFYLLSRSSPPQAGAWQLSVMTTLGGFMFGFGAAMNGACVYSTMARLADGEIAMAVTVIGFGLGIVGFEALLDAAWISRPSPSWPRLSALIGIFPAVILIAFIIHETVRLWRTRPPEAAPRELVLAPQYRLSAAAMLIGLAGGLVYIIQGPSGYASFLQQGIEAMLGRRDPPETARFVLVAAVMAGMLISTLQRKSFHLDWKPRPSWVMNLFGGVLMGLGVALAHGGNDSLVLYAIPTLSPHALPAYVALVVGVAAGLLTIRLLLGIETRAECRNDYYYQNGPSQREPTSHSRMAV
jgi:uncharacterized membrane protein YedE/YeeE